MATTTELEARIKELEARLREMDENRMGGRGPALVDELFPQESRKHMREAWKHNLLAVRSVLDHWIEKQDDGGNTTPKRLGPNSVHSLSHRTHVGFGAGVVTFVNAGA